MSSSCFNAIQMTLNQRLELTFTCWKLYSIFLDQSFSCSCSALHTFLGSKITTRYLCPRLRRRRSLLPEKYAIVSRGEWPFELLELCCFWLDSDWTFTHLTTLQLSWVYFLLDWIEYNSLERRAELLKKGGENLLSPSVLVLVFFKGVARLNWEKIIIMACLCINNVELLVTCSLREATWRASFTLKTSNETKGGKTGRLGFFSCLVESLFG